MSNFEQSIESYKKTFIDKLGRENFDEDLLRAIAKYLGPSIYSNDSSKVACSNKSERISIKEDFLITKLGLTDSKELDEAISDVCTQMGSSNRNKYRAVFYYLLVEHFGKESLFIQSNSSADKATHKTSNQEDKKQGKDKPSEIIERYALYAAGAGLVPIPLVDLASISAVQYRMLKNLAHFFDHVSFEDQKSKSIIAGLIGGFSSFELGLFTKVLFRGVPIIGPIIAGTAVSGYAYYSTKLIGEIFEDHFNSGGDLSIGDLTYQKMKEKYREGIKSFNLTPNTN